MLLRKLKLDFSYAVSELVIVVAGVMIALAADGLLQDRADRLIEVQYLAGLAGDLSADTAELKSNLRLAQERAYLGHRLLRAVDGDTVLSPVDLALSVERVMYFRYPAYSRSTISDLMSTGNLRLIRDQSLKQQLSTYYQRIERSEQWTVNWRQIQINLEYFLPELLDLDTREALISSEAPANGNTPYPELPWAPPLDVSEGEAARIIQRIKANPAVRPRIEGMIRTQGSQYSYLSGILAEAETTLQVVESALAR